MPDHQNQSCLGQKQTHRHCSDAYLCLAPRIERWIRVLVKAPQECSWRIIQLRVFLDTEWLIETIVVACRCTTLKLKHIAIIAAVITFTTRENILNQTGISHYSNNNINCKEQLFSKQSLIYENTGTNNSLEELPSSGYSWKFRCRSRGHTMGLSSRPQTSATTAQNHWCALQMNYD